MSIETRFSFPTEGTFRINIDMYTFGLLAQSEKNLRRHIYEVNP